MSLKPGWLHGLRRLHILTQLVVVEVGFRDRVDGAHAHRPTLIDWCGVHIGSRCSHTGRPTWRLW
jgi:hypothetical protein